MKALGSKLADHTFLFQGAGEANLGIAGLLAMAMEKREGVPIEEARKRIWMRDSRGLIVKGRSTGGISRHKEPFAQEHAELADLGEIVKTIKPTVLIGAAAQPGVFNEEVIRDLCSFTERPVIFALSNPTSKAECTAEEAYTFSEGKCIFASGSPFPAFEGFGKRFEPGQVKLQTLYLIFCFFFLISLLQGNNAYIFPGAALGVIAAGVRHIHESVFLFAAEGLASLVTEVTGLPSFAPFLPSIPSSHPSLPSLPSSHSSRHPVLPSPSYQEDFAVGRMYPNLTRIKEVSTKIAAKVGRNLTTPSHSRPCDTVPRWLKSPTRTAWPPPTPSPRTRRPTSGPCSTATTTRRSPACPTPGPGTNSAEHPNP